LAKYSEFLKLLEKEFDGAEQKVGKNDLIDHFL
jgi:hypothetical protein